MDTVARYPYAADFQRDILRLCVQRWDFLKVYREVMQPEFFENPLHSSAAKLILDFFDTYQEPPGEVALRQLVLDSPDQPGGTERRILELVVELFELTDNLDYVQDCAIKFARNQAVRGAIEEALGPLTIGEVDIAEEILTKSFQVGKQVEGGLGTPLLSATGTYLDHDTHLVPTLISILDSKLDGGLGVKELGVVMGSTGVGKSMFLCHVGKAALIWGKRVVHYTLELSSEWTQMRYDASLSGVPTKQFSTRMADVLRTKRRLHQRYGDALYIKEFPTRGASVSDLRNHYELMKDRVWKPDLVVVDYADLLRASRGFDEVRHELGRIYEDLRGWAMAEEIPIWTATQASRETVGKANVGVQHISESFQKAMTSDVVLALSQTDEERDGHLMRLHLAKSRRTGNSGWVGVIKNDFARIQFAIAGEDEPILGLSTTEVPRRSP